MTLVQINAYDSGSTGKIMLQIGRVAHDLKMHSYTFSSLRASKNPNTYIHFYIDNKFEYTVNQIKGFFLGNELSTSYIVTKRLLKKIDKIQPDIIHVHNLHGYYINYIMLFKYIKKHNIRVVWTLHDCWSFTGRCPHFQLTGCEKWKTGCSNCVYDRRSYPASVWFDRSRKNWIKKKQAFTGVKDLTIVTPSKWLADLVKQSYLKEYPVKVINNGIDLNIFKPTESDFREKYSIQNKYIILGVANSWGKRKGIDVFISLSKMLDDKFQIVLVGTNDTIDKELPENFISIHRTANQQELAEIYTAADLFVNPTREDTYPTVNMEALACGTPVLTFNTGGSPEIIDDTCGVVVLQNDIDSIKHEILHIFEDRPFSQEACLEKAKNFSMQERFMEYVKLYEQ
ncbi:MAG: glycosyltransferase [Clostridia bacterium]|nr:glycosyltransferase [Clostridia bacterium]